MGDMSRCIHDGFVGYCDICSPGWERELDKSEKEDIIYAAGIKKGAADALANTTTHTAQSAAMLTEAEVMYYMATGEMPDRLHGRGLHFRHLLGNMALQSLRAGERQAEEIKGLRRSLEFYSTRCNLLQQWQSRMRDPERTIVCDILANGQTLPDPDGARYTPLPPQSVMEWKGCLLSRCQGHRKNGATNTLNGMNGSQTPSCRTPRSRGMDVALRHPVNATPAIVMCAPTGSVPRRMEAEMAENTLLPCPFCGGTATFLETYIACDCCLADMRKLKSDTADQLVAAWNRRTPSQSNGGAE